jgi:hypothetical protein
MYNNPRDEQVKVAYGEWEQSRDRLKQMEKLLEDALKLHSEGAVAPTELMADVKALRIRTDELLAAALKAITARAEERAKSGPRHSGG